jgi:hypothetical protein
VKILIMSSNFKPLPSAMFMLILGFKGGKRFSKMKMGDSSSSTVSRLGIQLRRGL